MWPPHRAAYARFVRRHPLTDTRVSRIGLVFGRLIGLLLAGAGVFAGWALYSEFQKWTDPIYVRISLLIVCGGAVTFALIQGGRMFFAKTTAELGFTTAERIFGVAMVIAFFLVAFLLKLPTAAAGGPIALVTLILQAVIVVSGLLPILRRRQDGA